MADPYDRAVAVFGEGVLEAVAHAFAEDAEVRTSLLDDTQDLDPDTEVWWG